MTEDMFKIINYRKDAGVAWITFGRPEKLNAFTSKAYAELRDAIRLADVDPDIHIAVLTGSGRAFATGGDLAELLSIMESSDPLAMSKFTDSAPMPSLRQTKLVTIAAVNGLCYAGGLVIAALCDFVIAVEHAEFAIPEGRLGVSEAVSVTALFPDLGARRLKYMVLTGRSITAKEAKEMGLVTEVVSAEELGGAVQRLIDDIKSTDENTRLSYKKLINGLCPALSMETDFTHFNIDRLAGFSTGK